MKVGIMGGTFDPIHIGHLIAAERAREEAGLDEVWFLPANVPPHKPQSPVASAKQRWDMVVHAIEGHSGFRSIDLELTRKGPSYTIDTIKTLNSLYSKFEFSYIIGADMVMYLPKWYRIEEIVQHISFIGLQRPGYSIRLAELAEPIRKQIKLIPMPSIDISSTAIRERMKNNQSIRYLVPEQVGNYIEENRLYES
jgi:nicotinate-nucleotide adenylyltransferase